MEYGQIQDRGSIETDVSLDFADQYQIAGHIVWLYQKLPAYWIAPGVVLEFKSFGMISTRPKEMEFQMQSLARFPEENPNPVMRFSKDGELLYTNKAGHLILETWKFVKTKHIPAKYQSIINLCLQNKKPQLVDVAVDKRIFSLHFSPITDMDYVNIYGRDITDLKNAEEKLLKYS
jgi:hypothetical protein